MSTRLPFRIPLLDAAGDVRRVNVRGVDTYELRGCAGVLAALYDEETLP